MSDLESFLTEHAPLPTEAHLANGSQVGEWQITAFLGRGGTGEVYRVKHGVLGTVGALKWLIPKPKADENTLHIARERFIREARLLSQNTCPFFPHFFTFGEFHGSPYFIMELLDPIELPHTDCAVAGYLANVCKAVGALHARGWVHRDIKPQNILQRTDGTYVLIDMGLIKDEQTIQGSTDETLSIVDGHLIGLGTRRYAAPEQFNGEPISVTADIHALGMLANECFKGRPPYIWRSIIHHSTASVPTLRYGSTQRFMRAVRWRYWPLGVGCLLISLLLLCAGLFLLKTSLAPLPTPVEATQRNTFESLCEKIDVHGTTVLRIALNGHSYTFEEPIRLPAGDVYLEGPGALIARLDGTPTTTLHLANCTLVNLTREPLDATQLCYILEGDVYLNMRNQNFGFATYPVFTNERGTTNNLCVSNGPLTLDEYKAKIEADRLNHLYNNKPPTLVY